MLLPCGRAAAVTTPLEVVVDRADGEVFFKNPTLGPLGIDGYTIESVGDALVVANWTPIAGNFDINGDSSVDDSSAWFVIGTPTARSVSEVSLTSGSGSLAAGQIVSLGLFFNTQLLEGLLVSATFDGVTFDTILADFRDLRADYNRDLVIDSEDYAVFASTYGSTTDLRADGNADLIVNAADYTVWRDSASPVLTVSIDRVAVAFGVPEPTSLVVALFPVALSIRLSPAPARRRRRPR